jgi:hypothetical protein
MERFFDDFSMPYPLIMSSTGEFLENIPYTKRCEDEKRASIEESVYIHPSPT